MRKSSRKQEYKREAFELFGSLLDRVRADVVRVLMNVRIQTQEEVQQAEQQIEEESERRAEQARAQHSEFGLGLSEEPVAVEELTLPESDERMAKPAVSKSGASAKRSAATIRAHADRERSTSSAMGSCSAPRERNRCAVARALVAIS